MSLTLPIELALVFICMQYMSFENAMGKREIACNKHFLFFPYCFQPFLRDIYHFLSNLELLSANSLSLEESEISC